MQIKFTKECEFSGDDEVEMSFECYDLEGLMDYVTKFAFAAGFDVDEVEDEDEDELEDFTI